MWHTKFRGIQNTLEKVSREIDSSVKISLILNCDLATPGAHEKV